MEVEPRVPARRLRWLPSGDHTVLALPQRSPCVPPNPRNPEGDPGSVPSPLPLSLHPKPLTCADKEQDQLRKQDPWTPGQPPRVHPSRWPEVARQDRRTDRLERGLGAKGEPETRRGWRMIRGGGQHSRDGGRGETGPLPWEPSEGSPGWPARGCAGTGLFVSVRSAQAADQAAGSCVLGHPGSHFISAGGTDVGLGAGVASTPPHPPVLPSVEGLPQLDGTFSNPMFWLLLCGLASSFFFLPSTPVFPLEAIGEEEFSFLFLFLSLNECRVFSGLKVQDKESQ